MSDCNFNVFYVSGRAVMSTTVLFLCIKESRQKLIIIVCEYGFLLSPKKKNNLIISIIKPSAQIRHALAWSTLFQIFY